MARFYITNQPFKLTYSTLYHLSEHIRTWFSDVSYQEVCWNYNTAYGILEGSGDKLSEVFTFCSKSFNLERIFEDEFIGALSLYWEDQVSVDPETEEETVIKTLAQLLDEFSISYTTDGSGNVDRVHYARYYKKKLFKQICKNEFNDYNDLIANISKSVILLNEYKGSLDATQQSRLDSVLTAMKSIYDIDTCLNAMEEDIANISTIIPDYYTAKINLDTLTTLDDIRNATYR